jgi:hypothetical protein
MIVSGVERLRSQLDAAARFRISTAFGVAIGDWQESVRAVF